MLTIELSAPWVDGKGYPKIGEAQIYNTMMPDIDEGRLRRLSFTLIPERSTYSLMPIRASDVMATERIERVVAVAVPLYMDSRYIGSAFVVEDPVDRDKVKRLKGEWVAS